MGSVKNALHELFSGDFNVVILGEGGLDKYSPSVTSSQETPEEEFTFERFVVGNSNKFAHAAAKAVAEGQIRNFNPLFIYGESGLGKTHLLHAIRHEISKKHPEFSIVYVKGDDSRMSFIWRCRSAKTLNFARNTEAPTFF
jgi:chromosomal replication initiator protein